MTGHGARLRARHDGAGDTRAEVVEHLATEVQQALDQVMRVSLRLSAIASLAPREQRDVLVEQVDRLDAAVRRIRDTLFSGCRGPADDPAGPPGADVEVALVDPDGVIVFTNRAWGDFCVANGGDPTRAGVGRSYLRIAEAAPDEHSRSVARAIRTAVAGGMPVPTRTVTPCSAPGRPRAFDTVVATRFDDSGHILGATVTVTEIGNGRSCTPFGPWAP